MRPRKIQLKEVRNLGKKRKRKNYNERMNTGMFQHGGIEFSSTLSYAIQSQSNGRFSNTESIKVKGIMGASSPKKTKRKPEKTKRTETKL